MQKQSSNSKFGDTLTFIFQGTKPKQLISSIWLSRQQCGKQLGRALHSLSALLLKFVVNKNVAVWWFAKHLFLYTTSISSILQFFYRYTFVHVLKIYILFSKTKNHIIEIKKNQSSLLFHCFTGLYFIQSTPLSPLTWGSGRAKAMKCRVLVGVSYGGSWLVVGAGRCLRCWNRLSSRCEQRWGRTQRQSINTKMDDDLFQLRQLPWVNSSANQRLLLLILQICVGDRRRARPTRRSHVSFSSDLIYPRHPLKASVIYYYFGYLAGCITEKWTLFKESWKQYQQRT